MDSPNSTTPGSIGAVPIAWVLRQPRVNKMDRLDRWHQNDKLGFFISGLTVILLAKLVLDQFSRGHELREHERRYHGGGRER